MTQQTVNETSSSDIESLGQFLQRRRTEKAVDLFQVAEETRIPLSTLEAMERGDYASLPANPFARGFYTIYARFLGLDTVEVLERYARERNISLNNQKNILKAPSILGKTASPMAERPLITPFSMLACSLVVLILLVVGFSWFFSWNPANFLSEKLRSFGKQPAVEQKTDGNSSSAAPSAGTPSSQAGTTPGHTETSQIAAIPSSANYTLLAEFQDPTKLTVTVDDQWPMEVTFSAGQTETWHATHAITMILPAQTKTRLSLNGAVLSLPAPIDGFITVVIPGSPPK